MAPPTRTFLLRGSDGRLAELDLSQDEQLNRLKPDEGQLVWLDLADPDATDVALLREHMGLHELAVEDLEKRNQRPKVDTYPGQHVIVAYEAIGSEQRAGDFGLSEVHLIGGDGYLVTVHWGRSPALEEVRGRWKQDADTVAQHFPSVDVRCGNDRLAHRNRIGQRAGRDLRHV